MNSYHIFNYLGDVIPRHTPTLIVCGSIIIALGCNVPDTTSQRTHAVNLDDAQEQKPAVKTQNQNEGLTSAPSERTWRPSITLSEKTDMVGNFALDIDNSGNVVALWQSKMSDKSSNLKSAIFNAAVEKWGNLTVLSEETGVPICGTSTLCMPRVVFSQKDEAVAVWSNSRINDHEIRASHLTDLTKWAPSVGITDDSTIGNFVVQLVSNRKGKVAAVWQIMHAERPCYSVRTSFFTRNEGWAGRRTVSLDCGAYEPIASMSQNGQVLSLWDQNVGLAHSQTWFGLFSPEGSVQPSSPLVKRADRSIFPTGIQYINGSSQAISLTRSYLPRETEIIARRLLSSASWGNEKILKIPSRYPVRTALSSSGVAHVFWTTCAECSADRGPRVREHQVWTSSLSEKQGWSEPTPLYKLKGDQITLYPAAGPQGEAILLINTHKDRECTGTYYGRKEAGGDWSKFKRFDEIVSASDGPPILDFVTTKIGPDGTGVVAWIGSKKELFIKHYR